MDKFLKGLPMSGKRKADESTTSTTKTTIFLLKKGRLLEKETTALLRGPVLTFTCTL